MRLKKLLFRATRSKVLTEFFDIEIPSSDIIRNNKSILNSCVYLIVYEDGDALSNKVARICQTFNGSFRQINRENISGQLLHAEINKEDTKKLIYKTRETYRAYLKDVNKSDWNTNFSLIQVYKWFILKEKVIYSALNKMEQRGTVMRAEFWCPSKFKERLEGKVNSIDKDTNLEKPKIQER